LKSQDLRPGMAIDIDGEIWLVTKYDHVKPGKGPAYAQIKLKNLLTGNHQEKRYRSSETVEQINLDRRDMEYLYSETAGAVFMDSETYDQATIGTDILGDALLYIKPNTSVNGLVYNENVITIELPQTVELKITDTAPGIKGATATNQFKEATCETGLKTRVPPFIKLDEVVRISTETGEYLGRVSGE
jgi:elongation factor P